MKGVSMERLSIDEVIEHCNKTCDMTEKIAKARGHELESIESKQFWEHYQVREWLKELKSYKAAEEQGLLLKLPCKVGNIVYVLEPCHCYNNYKENQNCHHAKTKATKYIDVVRVPKRYDSRSNTKCVKLYERPFKMNYLTKFGKTVFLTKEEAEQALKQMGE